VANTSAPLTESGIASMAASMLDDFHITSLDDDSTLGRFMAREFGYVRDEVLESYPWHFAKSRKLLAPTPTTSDDFGWSYKYQTPTDCLRLMPIRDHGTFNAPPVPFEWESGHILTNMPPSYMGGLPIHYIRRETNPTKFTPLFARLLATKLSMLAATRVTGKASYYDKMTNAYRAAMQEAVMSDTLSRGPAEDQYGDTALNVRGR
jgi:hypothetical protein